MAARTGKLTAAAVAAALAVGGAACDEGDQAEVRDEVNEGVDDVQEGVDNVQEGVDGEGQ